MMTIVIQTYIDYYDGNNDDFDNDDAMIEKPCFLIK